MYTIKNLKKIFFVIFFLFDENNKSIEPSNSKKNDKKENYPPEITKETISNFPPTKEIIEQAKKERKELIKKLGDNINTLLLKAKEKYKGNSEVEEKIKNLEIELGQILPLYLNKLEDIENFMIFTKEELEQLNKINDTDLYLQKLKEIEENKEKHKVTLDYLEKRIGDLKTKLKIIESEAEKDKRYEGVEKEFEKLKKQGKFDKIIGNKNFEELTAGDFHTMLKTSPEGVRSLLLATQDGNIVNINKDWDKYKNKILRVNFGKNKGLDKIIGAGDILDIFNVKEVKINGIEGIRRSYPRPGYYSKKDGHYLDIHDGYLIEITDTTKLEGDEENNEYKNALDKRFEKIRGKEIKQTLLKSINSNKNIPEIQLPYKSEVDQKYIEKIFSREDLKYFNIEISNNETLKIGGGLTFDDLLDALNGYKNISSKLTNYLSNLDLRNKTNIEIPLSKIYGILNTTNTIFIQNALNNIISNDKVKINIESGKIKIDTSYSKLKLNDIFPSNYEYKGKRIKHLKYKLSIEAASEKYGVPQGAIIQLIYHENGKWNPKAKNPGKNQTAYGLGQMIDGTWARFGKGLDRNNPAHQLLATAKYMRHIKNVMHCSWQEVLAYYNTGLGIKKVKDINKYYNANKPIRIKQPNSEPRNNKNYFIAAVAYYNDLSFYEAKKGLEKGFKNEVGKEFSIKNKETLESKEKISGKESLILHFSHGNIENKLKSINEKLIKNNDTIFIFRNGKGKENDLSGQEINLISEKFKKINPNLKIFIDQEGGKVTRFKDFDNTKERNEFLGDTIENSGITNKKEIAEILKEVIGENYYPSLLTLSKKYDEISENLKEDYLKAITYLRLKTLKERGINTYGLVTDLNLGNEVITPLERSFSKNPDKYEKLGKAMIDNAEKLGMEVYLKHFPGHGIGADSHKGILYVNNKNYLRKNMHLFENLIDYGKEKGVKIGLMVGHMIIPEELKNNFKKIISKSDYILTDDLGMDGYKLAKGITPKDMFFTTTNIGRDTIIVNTKETKGVK